MSANKQNAPQDNKKAISSIISQEIDKYLRRYIASVVDKEIKKNQANISEMVAKQVSEIFPSAIPRSSKYSPEDVCSTCGACEGPTFDDWLQGQIYEGIVPEGSARIIGGKMVSDQEFDIPDYLENFNIYGDVAYFSDAKQDHLGVRKKTMPLPEWEKMIMERRKEGQFWAGLKRPNADITAQAKFDSMFGISEHDPAKADTHAATHMCEPMESVDVIATYIEARADDYSARKEDICDEYAKYCADETEDMLGAYMKTALVDEIAKNKRTVPMKVPVVPLPIPMTPVLPAVIRAEANKPHMPPVLDRMGNPVESAAVVAERITKTMKETAEAKGIPTIEVIGELYDKGEQCYVVTDRIDGKIVGSFITKAKTCSCDDFVQQEKIHGKEKGVCRHLAHIWVRSSAPD